MPLNPFDIIILTKNSEHKLRECLDAIYRNVPINRLIIVDAYSTDKTVQIIHDFCSDHGVALRWISDEGNRATSRQKGLESVETEWFMFVDSDVVLNPNWFNDELLSLVNNPKVGAIDGYDFPVTTSRVLELREAMSLLRKLLNRTVKREIQTRLDRGFTGDTLIRTKAVEGIKIPTYLDVYEDNYIKRFIEKKGFKWVVSEKSTCKHYVQFYKKFDIIDCHAIGYEMEYLKFRNIFRALLTAVPKGIFACIVKKNVHLFYPLLYEQLLTLIGYLKGRFYYG